MVQNVPVAMATVALLMAKIVLNAWNLIWWDLAYQKDIWSTHKDISVGNKAILLFVERWTTMVVGIVKKARVVDHAKIWRQI